MNSKNVPIAEIATIRTILLFRDKPPPSDEHGNAYALTIRDIVSGGPNLWQGLQRITVNLPAELSNGDILMPARGSNYPARYFIGSDKPVFPVGQIFVIRPHRGLDGRYLTWYLNHQLFQTQIARVVSGTTVQSLNKSKLLNLSVALPPLELQARIAKCQELLELRIAKFSNLISVEQDLADSACVTALG